MTEDVCYYVRLPAREGLSGNNFLMEGADFLCERFSARLFSLSFSLENDLMRNHSRRIEVVRTILLLR